ncbi:MAG: hypothetical protein FJ104_16855, partial [Deltaproteobacteria bacterium]|nr:hypothetical protein [Deltaproteobacteria bacterium]
LWWFRRRPSPVALPLALTVGLALLLGSGALHRVTLASPAVELFGVHALDASDWLYPGLPADVAIGMVTAYAFAQSVHYAVWLVYVPADDTRAEAPRSFRASLRGLRAELGSPGLAAVTGLAAVAVGLGLASPVATRHVVLSVLGFHTLLELVVIAHAVARPTSGGARP